MKARSTALFKWGPAEGERGRLARGAAERRFEPVEELGLLQLALAALVERVVGGPQQLLQVLGQIHGLEGLGAVVIRPELPPPDEVPLLGLAREDEHLGLAGELT